MPSGSPDFEESQSVLTYDQERSDGHGVWERSETNSGIPYYINHSTGETQWDHPEITTVMHKLDGMNDIQYGAYRTAMKLRAVQKACHLHLVDRHSQREAWTQHGLGEEENGGVMTPAELEEVLATMFSLARGNRPPSVLNIENASQICLSWALTVLDSGRTGTISVRMAKVVLMALSTSPLEDKYDYMFTQVATPRKRISASQLSGFIKDILLLPKEVFESATFGEDQVEPAVASCYDTNGKESGQAITSQEFLAWMEVEPRFIVWLPTMHRLAASETVKHEARCATCKAHPIVGLRFRCLKAFNKDVCQSCFFTQKLPKDVKPTHPFKEYCVATTSGDDFRDFRKVFRNKVSKKYRRKPQKKSYLDYSVTSSDEDSLELPQEEVAVQEEPRPAAPIQPRPVSTESGQERDLAIQNIHSRIGQLAGRLQELEQEGPPAHPHIVTAEIHPQGREPPRMGEYQPAQTEPDAVTFVNPLYHSQRAMEAPPTATRRLLPTLHSLEQAPSSPEDRPPSVHFADQFDYPTLKEERGGKADLPVPRPRGRALPTQTTPKVRDQPVTKETLSREPATLVNGRGTPSKTPGGGATAFISPGYGPQEYTDFRPQDQYGSYAKVLPPATTDSEDLRQIISDLVTQKEALVQDLEQLKGSTTMLSEPVVVERPSGLNPQLFHLQKDYMAARLETKEEQIRQLEQQLRALQQMVTDRTKSPTGEPVSVVGTSMPTGKVSRGVNISTSVLSERTDRSFYGNPDEDLALIVRTMTDAFPKQPAKLEAAAMGDGLLSAAGQVSRNFSSYSQELMGK